MHTRTASEIGVTHYALAGCGIRLSGLSLDPSFPRPVSLDGSGSPWTSPVCFRTPRYRGACAGQEPIWALVGAVVTRHLPLIWCDFVSHHPPRNDGGRKD